MNLQDLFSVQTLFLALGIGVIVSVIKSIAEARFPTLKAKPNWGKTALPSIAIAVGAGLAVFSSVMPGFLVNASLSDRIVEGVIAGFFSSYVFRATRTVLKKELPADDSIPPEAK